MFDGKFRLNILVQNKNFENKVSTLCFFKKIQ